MQNSQKNSNLLSFDAGVPDCLALAIAPGTTLHRLSRRCSTTSGCDEKTKSLRPVRYLNIGRVNRGRGLAKLHSKTLCRRRRVRTKRAAWCGEARCHHGRIKLRSGDSSAFITSISRFKACQPVYCKTQGGVFCLGVRPPYRPTKIRGQANRSFWMRDRAVSVSPFAFQARDANKASFQFVRPRGHRLRPQVVVWQCGPRFPNAVSALIPVTGVNLLRQPSVCVLSQINIDDDENDGD